MLQKHAKLLGAIRAFFAVRDVLEVQTPLLNTSTVCDPHLESLFTQVGQNRVYLQTSPELAMKRLLASGSGSIYQICKAFRSEEQGQYHRPEFTMLEWYRVGFDYHNLMDEVELLISELLSIRTFRRLTYLEAFQQSVDINPFTASVQELKDIAGEVSGQLSREDLLDLIIGTKVIPAFKEQGIFIYNYPKNQAAQAKVSGEFAERFELIVDGLELANGYTELTDPVEQRKRFEYENEQRRKSHQDLMPIDEDFLKAIKTLPECAGVALGFDRLLMLATGKKSLDETLLCF